MAISPLPKLLLDRLERQFGSQGREGILAGFRAKRAPTFRTNTLKTTDEKVMNFLREHRIAYERVKTIPHAFIATKLTSAELLALPICTEGLIYVQGLSSMLPPLVLDAKPEEHILDLCAAPGSKTSQIAAMMNNTGRLVAIEKDAIRFQKLEHTLTLQGVTNTEAVLEDAIFWCKASTEKFDAILADVPCSAEGRIDLSSPRSFHFWSEKNIIAHAKLQRSILRAAVPLLKPSGRLIYSTCTLAPEENEKMILFLREEFPTLRLTPITSPLPSRAVQGGILLLPNTKHEGLFVSELCLR